MDKRGTKSACQTMLLTCSLYRRAQAVCAESVLQPEPERFQYERTPDNDAQEISAVSPTERPCTCGDGGLLKKFSYVVFFLSLSMFLLC